VATDREVAGVDLPDPVFGKARTQANGAGARLVANHANGEIETIPLGGIAIVCGAHIYLVFLPYLVVLDQK
jgi:hypothetical protein